MDKPTSVISVSKTKEPEQEIFAHGLMLLSVYIIIRAFLTPTFKFLTSGLHPFAIDTYAGLVAVIVFGLLVKGKLPRISALTPAQRRDFYFMNIPLVIGGLSFDLALLYLPVKAFALLVSFLPIVVGFYSGILLKEAPSKVLWLAAALATFGAVVFKTSGAIEFGIGDILTIVGVLLFAITPILNRKYVKLIGVNELNFFGWVVYVAPAAILAGLVGGLVAPPTESTYLIVLAAYAGILAVTTGLQVAVARHMTAHTFMTISTALVPIGAIAIAIAFLGESMGLQELLGGVLMISAAVLAVWRRK
jgi:drug/metabolite transporter (DMT)-like permease